MIGKKINLAPPPNIATIGIDNQITQWIYDSHYWHEETLYHFRCHWCDKTHSPGTGISRDDPPCPENPILNSYVGRTAMANITKAIKEA